MKRLAVLSAGILIACTSSTTERHAVNTEGIPASTQRLPVRMTWSQPEGNSLNFYLARDEAGPFFKLDHITQDGQQLTAEVPSYLVDSPAMFLKACTKSKDNRPELCSPPVPVGH